MVTIVELLPCTRFLCGCVFVCSVSRVMMECMTLEHKTLFVSRCRITRDENFPVVLPLLCGKFHKGIIVTDLRDLTVSRRYVMTRASDTDERVVEPN
jgi:hypothetical protein